MTTAFDSAAIEELGWRQGAILGPALLNAARERAPSGIMVADGDWLIVTSHDCDLVADTLAKEPVVEVLRAVAMVGNAPDKQQVWGRNPRALQLAVEDCGRVFILSCRVHERWTIPRELLVSEAPVRFLDDKRRRLIAEWLAKRYIRAAFPTAFDNRWRPNGKLKEWTTLLQQHGAWIQGVYLRLNTLKELDAVTPYRCHVIVGVPAKARKQPTWATKRDQLDIDITTFWKQFDSVGIKFDGTDVLGTDEITLADLDAYQRFDSDWLSFADDSAVTPSAADMPG